MSSCLVGAENREGWGWTAGLGTKRGLASEERHRNPGGSPRERGAGRVLNAKASPEREVSGTRGGGCGFRFEDVGRDVLGLGYVTFFF